MKSNDSLGIEKDTNTLSVTEIKRLLKPIAKEYCVKRLYLFGPFAKGTATYQSEVDLLIDKGKQLSLLELSGMRLECEEVFHLVTEVRILPKY